MYLVKISKVDDVEVFKICLEYWNALACALYKENQSPLSASPLRLTDLSKMSSTPRIEFYQPILTQVGGATLLNVSALH